MQRVRSIISSGTQYIDTGFNPKGGTRIVVDFRAYDQTTEQQAVFGARPGTNNRFSLFTGNSKASLQADYYSEATLARWDADISGVDTTQRTVVDMSYELIVNGVTVKALSSNVFQDNYSCYLFANNNAGDVYLPGRLELFSCQIYDNGTLVRDYVPCLDDSGVACLYDQVNETYARNAGTGSFAVGYPPVMFRRRTRVESNGPVAVTITSAGNSSNCYATINGTKYTSAASGIEVVAGDVITFAVFGYNSMYKGTITIDGTQVVSATGNTTETYDWTVPKGIASIAINLNYRTVAYMRHGTITVTTA